MKYIMLLLMSISANAFAGSNGGIAIGSNGTGTSGGNTTGNGTSSFGVTVTDTDVVQKIPGRPKAVGGNKTKTTTQVLSNTYGNITGAVTNIQSTPTRANSGNKDSTVLGAESSFGSITSHKVEDFQNTVIRTKVADPSQQLCPQGYQYVAGNCVVPTPQCPGSPIAKVWNTITKTCDCPSGTPNWNGMTCIASCTGGQVFDGFGCSTPACSATNQTQTVACDAGYTGNKIQQRDYTCTNATTGTWGNWYDKDTSECVAAVGCSATNQQQTVACGTGFTGNKTQQRDYTCQTTTSGSWGNWYDIDASGCTTPPTNNKASCLSQNHSTEWFLFGQSQGTYIDTLAIWVDYDVYETGCDCSGAQALVPSLIAWACVSPASGIYGPVTTTSVPAGRCDIQHYDMMNQPIFSVPTGCDYLNSTSSTCYHISNNYSTGIIGVDRDYSSDPWNAFFSPHGRRCQCPVNVPYQYCTDGGGGT